MPAAHRLRNADDASRKDSCQSRLLAKAREESKYRARSSSKQKAADIPKLSNTADTERPNFLPNVLREAN